MNILILSRRFPPLIGGAERVCAALADALARQGARVCVLTEQPRSLDDELRRTSANGVASPLPSHEPGQPGARAEVVRLASSPRRFIGTWRYLRALRREIDRRAARGEVDLIYVSMLKHDAYVAAGRGRAWNIPVVLRPEGAGATGDLAWQAWGRFGRTIGHRCRQADAIVTISPAIRAELLAAGYKPARLHDLPNGVLLPDPAAWVQPRDAHHPERPFHAIFIGRLAPEKGLDDLLRAWAIVRRTHPRASLTLVGEGPRRPALERLRDDLGLTDAVSLPGATDRPEAMFSTIDLFVLPSHEEGMSVALLEAMAHAAPIVASDIPGNRLLIESGRHGLLAPIHNPPGLARALLDLIEHPLRAQALGRAARDRVADAFSIDQTARTHLDLFQRLVQEKRRA